MTTSTQYFALKGGLDLATPPVQIAPGALDYALNWEPAADLNGYREHDGYERLDGQTEPHTLAVGAAREAARALITEVPGEGPVRGVVTFDGKHYAFRDNAGATACAMHVATAAGWAAVTTPALAPGGAYEFAVHNFYGTASGRCLYGVDGVNRAFQFDGSTFTQIATGMTTDTPVHLAAHQSHLWLAFAGGSLQVSPLGDPTATWTPVTGAAEIGTGEDITALVPMRDVLAVLCRDAIFLLYGSGSSTWQLQLHARESGAFAGTAQMAHTLVFLDARGLRTLDATPAYGDFTATTRGWAVQHWLRERSAGVRCSLLAAEKSQYRLFFAAGVCLTAGLADSKRFSFLPQRLPVAVACAWRGEIDGEEYLLVGADDGFVYRLDVGDSFDGADITAVMRLPFNHAKSPDYRKRWRAAVVEGSAAEDRQLAVGWEVAYGSADYPPVSARELALHAGGGILGDAELGAFTLGGGLNEGVPVKLTGSGTNLALIVSATRNGEAAATLTGVRLQFDVRRRQR